MSMAGPFEPGAVHSDFVSRRDEQLLAELTQREREIVEQAMANHPTLPLAKALAMLKAFGM